MSNASAAYLVSHEPRASCSGQGSGSHSGTLQLCAAERKQAHGDVPRRRPWRAVANAHTPAEADSFRKTASVLATLEFIKKLRGAVFFKPLHAHCWTTASSEQRTARPRALAHACRSG